MKIIFSYLACVIFVVIVNVGRLLGLDYEHDIKVLMSQDKISSIVLYDSQAEKKERSSYNRTSNNLLFIMAAITVATGCYIDQKRDVFDPQKINGKSADLARVNVAAGVCAAAYAAWQTGYLQKIGSFFINFFYKAC